MEKQSLRDVHVNVRDMFNRAMSCADDRKNIEYTITLLAEVVKRAPALEQARKKLRELELEYTPGMFAKLKASSSSKKAIPAIQREMTQSPLRAMALCEAELAKNLNNPPVLRLLLAAARALKAQFIEVETLEILHHCQPNDSEIAKELAGKYKELGESEKRVDLLTRLANREPGNYELQTEAKMAMNELNAIREEANMRATREKLAAAKSNVTLQIEDGTIHDERQARMLINKFNMELKNSDSLDVRRKLAEAYMVAGEFDSAIKELEYVSAKLGTADPALDKAIEAGYVAKFNAYLDALREHPEDYENPEQQIEEYTRQRDQFKLERAEQRLKMYPNDSQLQYDFAVACYENGRFNEATEYFLEAYKSARLKLASAVYLGRCGIRRKDYDSAIDFLSKAAAEMLRMDRKKLEALYYLGMAYERAGKFNDALEQFSTISSNHPGYRDVDDHIANCRQNL